ncbi:MULTISPECIES: hypothetical protein [unclassified Streptomyces]|uniref:hypothetical protein n=1 Tax=unclassified Streptomyces TaxID=2593676 RepID=UPI00131E64C8|nr:MULTISPECIES: hypothetical protein [unclassified Streptomyces]
MATEKRITQMKKRTSNVSRHVMFTLLPRIWRRGGRVSSNMTTARFHGLPHRDARKDSLPAGRVVTAGKYIYTPGVARSLEARGTLRGDGVRIEPHATESLLREFLTLLEAVQEELNQRWTAQANSDCHADRV